MDAREFDELIARIASAANRRSAVKGALRGALAGVGIVDDADVRKTGEGKNRNHHKEKAREGKNRDVVTEHNGGNGKRTLCLCQQENTTTVAPTTATSTQPPLTLQSQGRQPRALVCETRTLKTKKAKKALRTNPGSYRGPRTDPTATSTSTSTTSIIAVDRQSFSGDRKAVGP